MHNKGRYKKHKFFTSLSHAVSFPTTNAVEFFINPWYNPRCLRSQSGIDGENV